MLIGFLPGVIFFLKMYSSYVVMVVEHSYLLHLAQLHFMKSPVSMDKST